MSLVFPSLRATSSTAASTFFWAAFASSEAPSLVLDYDAVRNSDHVDTTSLDFSTERGRNLNLSLASLPPGLIAVTVLVVRTLTVGRGAACLTKQAAQSAKFRSLDIRSAEGQLRR